MANKLTQDQFVAKCNDVHNSFYDYSKTIYTTSKNNVLVLCPIHGVFSQRASNHSAGVGCPHCFDEKFRNLRKHTQETFLLAANKIHGNKYTYENSVYNTGDGVIIITCPVHGDFKQVASTHLEGKGCKQCARLLFGSGMKLDKEKFIERAKKTHGDKFDYSKVVYTGSREKVTIRCREHGDFEQLPVNHIYQNGCPKCGANVRADSVRTHGMAKHPLYGTWRGMIGRCYDENHKSYKDYGGRGIRTETDFLYSVESFIKYTTSLPKYELRKKLGLSLDRIDNDSGYLRGNLRWATKEEQNNNRRNYKKTEHRGIRRDGSKIISFVNIRVYEGESLAEAIAARNNFIIEHNLPNRLNKLPK